MVCALGAFVIGTVVQEYARAIRVRMRKRRRERAPGASPRCCARTSSATAATSCTSASCSCCSESAGSVLNEERLENVKPGGEIRIHDYRLRVPHGGGAPGAALRRRGRAHRALRGRAAARRDGAREAHVLARAAAGLDPVDLLDAARGPLRDPHRARGRRLRHAQGLPQPARQLDLDRRRRLRARHARGDVAASGRGARLRSADDPRRTLGRCGARTRGRDAAGADAAAGTARRARRRGTIRGTRSSRRAGPPADAGLPVLLYALPEAARRACARPSPMRRGVSSSRTSRTIRPRST